MVKPADKPVDRLGREIKVGDYVVNASSAYGNTVTMNFGMVVDLPLKVREDIVSGGHWDYATNLRVPAVYEAVEFYKVRVAPCNLDGTLIMESVYDPATRTSTPTNKPVRAKTIEHLDRIAVVSLV